MDKVGMVFLLDRVNGRPIFGAEERHVPQSEVPLERVSKTQPFPLKPPPLARMTFSQDDIATVTPELEAACRKLIAEGTIAGGMIPKVETCIYALEHGVEGVVILDGQVEHAVLLELLTDHGVGTLIHG